MSKTTKPVLSAEMIAVNEASKQTKWIDFAGNALCFFKRHVPNAPEGYARYVHLFRNEAGEAWMFEACEKMPADLVQANEVRLNGRDYAAHVSTTDSKIAGALVDTKGRIYKLVRATCYDLNVKAAD